MKQAILKIKITGHSWGQGKELAFQILDWENVLSEEDLPKEYFEERPYFHETEYGGLKQLRISISKDANNNFWLFKGAFLNVEKFLIIKKAMKEAGIRLTIINKNSKFKERIFEFKI
ncbi:MAG: hypothetical protein ACFFDY_01095 [Candidatus Thorarchaeota archaeon]